MLKKTKTKKTCVSLNKHLTLLFWYSMNTHFSIPLSQHFYLSRDNCMQQTIYNLNAQGGKNIIQITGSSNYEKLI